MYLRRGRCLERGLGGIYHNVCLILIGPVGVMLVDWPHPHTNFNVLSPGFDIVYIKPFEQMIFDHPGDRDNQYYRVYNLFYYRT